MPRLTYIVLSLLLLLQAGGAMMCCQVQQVRVRWEQHEAMQRCSKPQERLELSEATWKQCRHGDDELQLNGVMYDVVRMDQHGTGVSLTVVRDEEEGEIMQLINRLLTGGGDSAPLAPVVVSLLQAAYLLPDVYNIALLPRFRAAAFPQWEETLLCRAGCGNLHPPEFFV